MEYTAISLLVYYMIVSYVASYCVKHDLSGKRTFGLTFSVFVLFLLFVGVVSSLTNDELMLVNGSWLLTFFLFVLIGVMGGLRALKYSGHVEEETHDNPLGYPKDAVPPKVYVKQWKAEAENNSHNKKVVRDSADAPPHT